MSGQPPTIGQEFRNRRVLVMGLGVHGGGLGVARWLLDGCP